MTEIIRFIVIGITGAILVITLQQQKKEIALILGIAVGILLLWEIGNHVKTVVEGIRQMAADVGIAGDHLKLLLKLLAISYLTEFGCEICKDAGQQFLAGKIQLGGKLMMAALSLPVFQSLLSFITEVLT